MLILTPPNTHLELVERCAAAGKHILLEKPLEITYARAETLVKRAAKVTLGVVLQHRFRPAAEKLHELLAAGKLGTLISASASIPNWRPQSYYDQPGRGTRARDGGGVLLTQGIHTLDLLTWFAGEAAEVKSYWTTTPVHRMETEDLACAALRFRNGALGVVHATTTAYPGYPERIELIGNPFENIGEAVDDRIHQFDKDRTTGQRLGIRCEFAVDEIAERGYFLEPHRYQPFAGQHEPDRRRYRLQFVISLMSFRFSDQPTDSERK